MSYYGAFFRNIRRSTQFLRRRRSASGERHYVRSALVRPIAGSRKPPARKVNPYRALWSLSWPGLAVTLLGRLVAGQIDSFATEIHVLGFFFLSAIFAARAATANAPIWVRAFATVVCLGFPVLVVLGALGVVI